jgi:putative FmdB family regulatory protein
MPLYEFQCTDCDKPSELLVRSSDFSGEKCPHCGSDQIVKQLSTFAPAAQTQAELPPQCTGNPNACGMCQ